MKRILSTALAVVALVALAAVLSMAVGGRTASAAQYQYGGKPALTISVVGASASSYTIHVAGSGYFAGSQPGGQLQLTCGGKKGTPCGPAPAPWPAGPVGTDGTFAFDYVTFDCGSNVKSLLAIGNDGVKSNSVKGSC